MTCIQLIGLILKNLNSTNERQLRDKIKKELCEEHNLKMLYFSFKKFNDDIITDKNELINIINKN